MQQIGQNPTDIQVTKQQSVCFSILCIQIQSVVVHSQVHIHLSSTKSIFNQIYSCIVNKNIRNFVSRQLA